jgi:tetratricopeptide (TPR) repeat protein
MVGQRISHYQLVERIGGGGMGVVYKAEDTRLGRTVALKFVADDLSGSAEALGRFTREARAASALNHPNICTIHDIGDEQGRSFIVMEYLEGTTLQARLAAGPLDVDTVLEIGAQIADALDAAHTAGIIHRDIKPANIFIGSRDRVKVLDFGLAKLRAGANREADETTVAGTEQGVVMGTVAYMAPEQANGQAVDHRADIWSFGVVLCEMATGKRPTPGIRLRVAGAPELEPIIARCLEPDRERRYQHASELHADLDRLRRGANARLAQGSAVKRRLALWLAVGAGAAVAVLLVVNEWVGRRPAVLTDKDTIVLAEFANTTGDPVFDETLRQGLAVQLQQSPFLSIISDERIRQTLALMQAPTDARLTAELAQDVCVRAGSAAVLAGSISSLGSQYVIALSARNCHTGDILADEQAQAARKEDVLSTLSQIAVRFRTRVGESVATIEQHSVPLDEATTSSLEALKAFSTASKAYFLGDAATALPLFKRALELDPNFASAHARVGIHYSNVGEWALARESTLQAYRLRDRASQAERFWIDTFYDRQVTGNLERQLQTMETWARTYPRDPAAIGLVGGLATSATGRYELSIEAASKALALDPDRGSSYSSKAFSELSLNRLADAENTIRQALERKVEFTQLYLHRYFVAFASGDAEGMKRNAAVARERRGTADMMSHIEALDLARRGRLQDSRQASAVAIDMAAKADQRERAALFSVARAVVDAFYGRPAGARAEVATSLEIARGRDVDYAAAFALAMADDLTRSRMLADDLAREYPEDTCVQYMYLPTLRALYALEAKDAPAAIQALQPASRFDLGVGTIGVSGYFGRLYPIYVRGLSYLAAQQPARAAGEFQRILDHRSIVLVDPVDAMARLQLARALALSGDVAKAKTAYADALALWKDADATIPVVQAARAEYGRLQ